MPAGTPGAVAPARQRWGAAAVVGLLLGGVAAALVSGPFPQPQAYHDFADRRAFLGIQNGMDVLSNAPFLIVGLLGIRAALASRRAPYPPAPWERAGFLAFASGVALVALGSAAYHLDPRDSTLVLDRLPMALAFSALFALVLGERVSARVGRATLLPAVLVGIASVAHWAWTLSRAPGGDLRAYLVVKYVPLLSLVALLSLVPEPRSTRGPLWASFAAFAVATAFEVLDAPVFRATGGLVSGHTLKHLLAAGATAFLLAWFSRRSSLLAQPG